MSRWYEVTAVISVTVSVKADSEAKAEEFAKSLVEAQADRMGVPTTVTVTEVKEPDEI